MLLCVSKGAAVAKGGGGGGGCAAIGSLKDNPTQLMNIIKQRFSISNLFFGFSAHIH